MGEANFFFFGGEANFKQDVWCFAAKQTGTAPFDSSRAAESSRSDHVFSVVYKAVSGCLLSKETLDESRKADPVKRRGVRRTAAMRQWPLRLKPTKQNTTH